MSDLEHDDAVEAGLRRALALDEEELAFLRAAALPQRLAAQVAARQPHALALDLLWIAVPATLGYAAWLLASPVLATWLAVARQAGLTSLVARLLTSAVWGAIDLFASIVEAASVVPGFDAPLVAISLLAAATYALTAGTPLVRRREAAV